MNVSDPTMVLAGKLFEELIKDMAEGGMSENMEERSRPTSYQATP